MHIVLHKYITPWDTQKSSHRTETAPKRRGREGARKMAERRAYRGIKMPMRGYFEFYIRATERWEAVNIQMSRSIDRWTEVSRGRERGGRWEGGGGSDSRRCRAGQPSESSKGEKRRSSRGREMRRSRIRKGPFERNIKP